MVGKFGVCPVTCCGQSLEKNSVLCLQHSQDFSYWFCNEVDKKRQGLAPRIAHLDAWLAVKEKELLS